MNSFLKILRQSGVIALIGVLLLQFPDAAAEQALLLRYADSNKQI